MTDKLISAAKLRHWIEQENEEFSAMFDVTSPELVNAVILLTNLAQAIDSGELDAYVSICDLDESMFPSREINRDVK